MGAVTDEEVGSKDADEDGAEQPHPIPKTIAASLMYRITRPGGYVNQSAPVLGALAANVVLVGTDIARL